MQYKAICTIIQDMKIGAFIVPTGIGASIGGFAGDASTYARKLAEKCRLIVNPNVVNAACFSGISDNMLYGPGIGYRFLSPYGIVRVDIAMGIQRNTDERDYNLHFAFGPEF